ncbi:hypothetical protein J2Z50_005718 [Ensifer mexicanus]|nr:hypothetical protein [Sinorhizobium mexicanum]MBP1887403.1 hypothetical protein [Sinorhizobium mexicanum]
MPTALLPLSIKGNHISTDLRILNLKSRDTL